MNQWDPTKLHIPQCAEGSFCSFDQCEANKKLH